MNPIKLAGLALAVMLVSTTLVGPGAIGAGAAHPDQDQNQTTTDEPAGETRADKEVRIVDEEIVIADGVLTITDTTLKGPGLGEQHIEDRKYTVDSTVRFDGFHLTHDGTHYTICRVTVHIEDIGVRLQNVTLTEGGGETSATDATESCDC